MTRGPEKLEELIADLARSQPALRAPASLEARVLAQIAAEDLGWRKGFTHWPLAARIVFLVASFGFIKLALAGVMWVVGFVRASVSGVETLQQTGEAVSATVSLGAMVLHAIPPLWLYSGLAAGFMLYAVLFGLGTFAYRALYLQR